MYVCTFKEQLEVRGESLQEGANPLIGRTATTSSSCLSQTHADCKHLTPGLAVPSNARGKRLPWTRCIPAPRCNSTFPGESSCAHRILALSESSSKVSLS